MTVGQYRSAGIVLTDAQVAKLQLDSAGNLKASLAGATGASAAQVQGNVASSATDNGNPVKAGAKYNAIGYINPALTDGQRGDLQINSLGYLQVQVVSENATKTVISNASDGGAQQSGLHTNSHNLVFNPLSGWNFARGDANGTIVQPAASATFWQYAAVAGGIVNSTADVAIKAAAGAGVRNYLSSLIVPHDALGAASEYVVKDGAVVIFRGKLQTALSEGSVIPFNPPLRPTANTALNFALVALTVTGGTFVNAQGYTGS